MPAKPFKSENDEINALIDWVIGNFRAKDPRIVLDTVKEHRSTPPVGMQSNEIRVRTDGVFAQLVFRDRDGKFYVYPWVKYGSGFMKFKEAATVWDNLSVQVSGVRLAGANPADQEPYRDSYVLSFDGSSDEYAYFIINMSHRYKEGSDVSFNIHYTPKASGAGGGAENIKWDLTYSWANIGASFPASSSLSITHDAQNDSQHQNVYVDLGKISGEGKTMNSIMLCSLKRDTTVANNYTDEAYVVAIDFNYQIDTMGSDDELVKGV